MQPESSYLHAIKVLIIGALVTTLFAGCEQSVKIVNSRPVIRSLDRSIFYAEKGSSVQFSVYAEDADGDKLRYSWSKTGGTFTGFSDDGAVADWSAPQEPGTYTITVKVTDEIDEVSASIGIDVCETFPTTIEADTVISNQGFKYILKKTTRVVVPVGVTLTLNKGVTVVVSSEYGGLEVRGRLEANGAEGEEVAFIPNSCEEGSGLWGGIYFVGDEAVGQLRHLLVSSGKDGIDIDGGADVVLSNCTSYNNSYTGLSIVEGSSARVDSCKIWDNGKGVYIMFGYAEFYGSSIRYNGNAGFDIVGNSMDPPISIERCVIANNVDKGIQLSNAANPEIHNCSIFNNGVETDGYAIALFAYSGVDSIRAERNFWGLENDTEEEIGELIYDADDDPNIYAYVSFMPCLTSPPVTSGNYRKDHMRDLERLLRKEF